MPSGSKGLVVPSSSALLSSAAGEAASVERDTGLVRLGVSTELMPMPGCRLVRVGVSASWLGTSAEEMLFLEV